MDKDPKIIKIGPEFLVRVSCKLKECTIPNGIGETFEQATCFSLTRITIKSVGFTGIVKTSNTAKRLLFYYYIINYNSIVRDSSVVVFKELNKTKEFGRVKGIFMISDSKSFIYNFRYMKR